jgi:hypothetical protein
MFLLVKSKSTFLMAWLGESPHPHLTKPPPPKTAVPCIIYR